MGFSGGAPATFDQIIAPLVEHGQWGFISWLGNASAVSGGGVTQARARQVIANSGTASGATAVIATLEGAGWTRDNAFNRINWSRRIILNMFFSMFAGTANGQSWLTWGRTRSGTPADPAVRSIGVRVDNLSLMGIAHDGTSLTVVDLNTAIPVQTTINVRIDSDGDGNVTWYVNDVLAGSTSGGPTGLGDANDGSYRVESRNNADSAQQEIQLHHTEYFVGQ